MAPSAIGINDLPRELLSEAFLYAEKTVTYGLLDSTWNRLTAYSLVCRLWHQVIRNTPQLWNSCEISIGQEIEKEAERNAVPITAIVKSATTFFSRSGSLPLDLKIRVFIYVHESCGSFEPLVELLFNESFASRWRSIKLISLGGYELTREEDSGRDFILRVFEHGGDINKKTGQISLPNVEYLKIIIEDAGYGGEFIQPGAFPIKDIFLGLKRAHLEIWSIWDPREFLDHICLETLTDVEIESLDPGGSDAEQIGLHNVLGLLPQLERLRMCTVSYEEEYPVLVHKNLRFLHIQNPFLLPDHFPTLRLPALQSLILDLQWSGGSPPTDDRYIDAGRPPPFSLADAILPVFAGCTDHFVSLTILDPGLNIKGPRIVELLSHLPYLKFFEMEGHAKPVFQSLQKDLTLVPDLFSLTLNRQRFPVEARGQPSQEGVAPWSDEEEEKEWLEEEEEEE